MRLKMNFNNYKMNFISIKKTLFFFLIMMNGFTFAQGVSIGSWRDHLPYKNCKHLAEGNGVIYCASDYALFYYNLEDQSLNRLTKVEGLSDINISTINFNKKYNTLIIAYIDCNIDLIINNQIINISDIKRKNIIGNKVINRIDFIDRYAYLSCGFGIVVLDLIKKEIKDTYYIGQNGSAINVFDIATDGTKLFAATENGIYFASLNNPNISDYNAWTKDTLIDKNNNQYNLIACFNNKLFFNKSGASYNTDTVFIFDGKKKICFDSARTGSIRSINVFNNNLLITTNYRINGYDTTLKKTLLIWTYNPSDPSVAGSSIDVNDAIIARDGSVWVADKNESLVKNWDEWNYEKFTLSGPYSTNVFSMSAVDNKLWVASGSVNPSWTNLFERNGVYSFIDEKWSTFDYSNTSAFDTILDMLSIAIDPFNSDKVYAGSWHAGLLEFNNNSLSKIYNTYNSPLDYSMFENVKVTNIAGLCFDNNENLWVAVSYVNNTLMVKKNDGTWQSYNIGYMTNHNAVTNLIIDSYNQKWMVLTRGGGILVFNDNNTLDDKTDDQVKVLDNTSGNGGLPSKGVYCLAQDNSGQIWVGTDQGIAVFYNPENVFTGENFDAQQILVERGGFAQYLLSNEIVTAIAVDGSNKKWIGTQSAGVFLLSADGTQQLMHFTSDNSPLFSDNITSIAINGTNGEVFFGTENGIVSYKGFETDPQLKYSDVYAYPNPVRENYNGTIAIKGLEGNSDVKITDVSGALVFATKADGGQATWDGKNFKGEKVHTGVYLVFCSNLDNKESLVTKILVVH